MSQVKNRGFASLSPIRLKEIAAKGGYASHKKGVAHRFTHEEAVAAGRKGKKKYGTITRHI